MGTYFPDGKRSSLVDELFGQAGVVLACGQTPKETNDFLQRHMRKARPEGVARWDLTNPELHDPKAFTRVVNQLSLNCSIGLPEEISEVELLVVPGATYRSMHHRLRYALSCCCNVGKIAMLGSHRPLNDLEAKTLGKRVNCNEGTAAQYVLFNTALPLSVMSTDVLIAPNREDGSWARTDETIELLVNTLDLFIGKLSVVFALHQPYGWRQALTIMRVMQAQGVITKDWVPTFIMAPPIKPLHEVPARTLDEVCKIVYELTQLTVAA